MVPAGRIFLRCLIDIGTTVSHLHHHVTLNREAKVGLNWWIAILPTWPGTSLLLQSHWSLATDMELATDVSNLGYWAFWAGRWWFSLLWPPALHHQSIAWREMYAIIIACTTWGPSWQRCRILPLLPCSSGRSLAERVLQVPQADGTGQSSLFHISH